MVYPDPKFFICKTKKQRHFFLRLEAYFFLIPCYNEDICNKFIEIKFSVGHMVWACADYYNIQTTPINSNSSITDEK